jgi:soluble lytic murein transglycosylase-like protein
MATPLTWRDVAAPDFRGVQQGINSAAELFSRSATGLSGVLGQFGDQNTLQQLTQYNDAQKLQADIQSGQFNTANASPKALAAIMDRPATLLQDASNAQTLAFNAQRNPLVLEGLGNQNAQSAQTLAHNAQRNPLLLQELGLKNQQAVLDLGQEQSNVANQKAALSLLDSIRKNAGGPDDVRRMLSNQSPEVSALVQQGLGNSFGTLYGSTAAVDPNQVTSLPAEQLQKDAEFNSLWAGLTKQESGGLQFKRGSVVTSPRGAVGIAQVMPATAPEAAALAKLPWNSELFNRKPTGDPVKDDEALRYNEALGQAYLKKQIKDFGSVDKALAAYNAGPGATRQAIAEATRSGNPDNWLSFLSKETRNYVPSILGRTSAPSLSQTINSTQAGNRLSQAQKDIAFKSRANDPTGVVNAVMKNIGSEASTQEVVNELTGKGGIFEGANITNQLNDIMRQTGAPAAVAGDILARNVKRETWDDVVKRYLFFSETSEIGNDTLIRDAGVERDIRTFNSPVVKDILRRNEAINELNADAAEAITALKQSEELLIRAQGLSSTLPGQAAQIPNLQAQVSKQQSKVSQLLNKLSDLEQVK